ncbi:unnamed protein product [Dovyalis caffra]|uniref:Uncharacterized protein n=1 Tax=Dovyalis caffra TaxID=77055 RepID=A0AAV1RFX4_9ROSI|nr:unnamed protein product [Dovyalis caffra]
MGVSTTLDAPRSILQSNALHHLCPCKFVLGTPPERMDAVVEAVLMKQCSGFGISHNVANFLRNYFVSQDGTITSFIRALKALDPESFKSRAADNGGGVENDSGVSSSDCYKHQQYHTSRNSGFICQAVRKLRDLPAMQLHKLLKNWEKYTVNVPQIHGKVKKLLSEWKSEDGKSLGQDLSTISKRHASRKHLRIEDSKAVNERAAKLLESMVRYALAQEHGDLINLHDWYQSFKSVALCSSNKKKHRSKYSPSPKKRKATTESAQPSEASIQYPIMSTFLQGSNRAPDYRAASDA